MHRYVNPHPTMIPQVQQQVPQQQIMQPQIVMTQQGPMMVTPQGMVPVPGMQQPQQQVIMTAQGPMIMTPQGMVPAPMMHSQQGQGIMAMHGGTMPMVQQGQFPQQQFPTNQPAVVQSRFGTPSTTMDPATMQSPDGGNSRYQTFQTPQQAQQMIQQQTEMVQEPTRPPLFIVTPTNHKFTGNDKFKMGVITEALKAANVNFEDGYVACNCLEETVEAVVEVALRAKDVCMVTVRNFIVNNNFYRVDFRELMTKLTEKDTKNLYKLFKAQYTKTTDKHQINVLNSLNTLLTDVINDYLAVNSVAMISIESFYTDYNDLLKVIDSTESELEEGLVDYLDKYVADMKTALTNTAVTEGATQITEMVTIAYLDRMVQETGLDVLGHGFVQLDDSIANHFLKSIVAEVVAKASKSEFLLVTLDKSIFKFMVAANADIYIKKIA